MMRVLILMALLASPAHALEAARDAAVQLQTAAQRLQQAQGAEDRISALTDAVAAYDGGLAALRDGLRQLSVREAALAADLTAREDRVSRLIGVLTGIERTPRPLLLLHPEGPMGTARAAMLLGDAAPALEAEARALRTDLETLTTLRSLEEDAAGSLEEGLNAIQSAREALSIAISDRAALPARFASDGEGLADLRTRATTLASFAEGMADLPGAPAVTDAALPLPLPGRATLLRGYRQADAAGITRPGMILSLSPQALVSAPTRATVRYAGPLLDYGLVIILEPRPDALIVLAGLDQAYVRQGDILASGAALGLMGETAPSVVENATSGAADGGALLSKTLYVEVREMGVPVDPAQWFDLDGSDPSTSE